MRGQAHATKPLFLPVSPVVRPERKPGILLGFLLVFPFGFWNWSPGLGQLLLGSLGTGLDAGGLQEEDG